VAGADRQNPPRPSPQIGLHAGLREDCQRHRPEQEAVVPRSGAQSLGEPDKRVTLAF
jgi:hypothetical protein